MTRRASAASRGDVVRRGARRRRRRRCRRRPRPSSVSTGRRDVGDRLVGDHRRRRCSRARTRRGRHDRARGRPAGRPPGWPPRTPRRARSGRGPGGRGTRRARRHGLRHRVHPHPDRRLAAMPDPPQIPPGVSGRWQDPRDGHRTVRAEPDRGAAPRQPADGAAGLALRPLGGQPVPAADRGPRPGHQLAASTRPASSPTSRALGLDWDGPVVRQSERRDAPRGGAGRRSSSAA